jgi:hypothetical protein
MTPEERQREFELWDSGRPYAIVPGYDGFYHPAPEKDLPGVVSPVVPPSAADSPPEGKAAEDSRVAEHMQDVPRIALEEVQSLEIRPGQPQWQAAGRSYPAGAEPIQRIVELLARTEGVASREIAEVPQGPNLVILKLRDERELRFSVRLNEWESMAFLPATYLAGGRKEVGILVNSALDRTLRSLYTSVATPADVQTHLDALRQGLEARGLMVLDVQSLSVDPLAIAVTLPRARFVGPDGLFAGHRFQREITRLAAEGLPVEAILQVFQTDDGEEVADFLPRTGDIQPVASTLGTEEVRQQVAELAESAAKGRGVRVDAVEVTDEGGLVVALRARSGAGRR